MSPRLFRKSGKCRYLCKWSSGKIPQPPRVEKIEFRNSDVCLAEKRTKLEWKWERFLSVNSKMRCTQEKVVKWELAQYSSLHTQKKSWIKLSEFLQIRWGFFFVLTKSQKWEPKNASFEGSKKAPSEEVFWALETSFLRFCQNKKNSSPNLQNFGQLLPLSFFD